LLDAYISLNLPVELRLFLDGSAFLSKLRLQAAAFGQNVTSNIQLIYSRFNGERSRTRCTLQSNHAREQSADMRW